MKDLIRKDLAKKARNVLGGRNLVFVGLMGAGKSAIGKMTAQAMNLPFADSDREIEIVSRMTVDELFSAYGEPEFRALETRVIERLLKSGPRIVSTGGGAFINDHTRQVIKESKALSIWINADFETLWTRVSKRNTRPLLKTADPRGTLQNLMNIRYPIYADADIEVMSRDAKKEIITNEVLQAIVAAGTQTHMETHGNAG